MIDTEANANRGTYSWILPAQGDADVSAAPEAVA